MKFKIYLLTKDKLKISELLNEAKKSRNKRKPNSKYENIKSFLETPKIGPTEVKIKTPNIKMVNQIQSLKISSSLNSLIRSKILRKSKKYQTNNLKKIKKHQLIPVLAPRDAVGDEVLAIRDVLRNLGYISEIYVETIHPEMSHESKKFFSSRKKFEEDILIYHHAVGSKLADAILDSSSKIIMIYHNITPEDYFKGINDDVVESNRLGREQLTKLKDKVSLTITHSEFSSKELRRKGFSNVITIPFLIDFSSYDVKTDDELIKKFGNSVNMLFVGRFVPHKRIENIIKIFAYYNTCINSNSNLFLVGSYVGMEKYYQWLRYLVEHSKLSNVYFVTKLDDKELASYYKLADIYLSMSEHEGFGVPLVESMYFGIPIIAYNSSAVPDTLGGSGLVIDKENAEDVGELINLVLNDKKLAQKIIQKQHERLKAFDFKEIKSQLEKSILINENI